MKSIDMWRTYNKTDISHYSDELMSRESVFSVSPSTQYHGISLHTFMKSINVSLIYLKKARTFTEINWKTTKK